MKPSASSEAHTAETSRVPSGTVTFLFSDIEGSTRLLQRHGSAYADVLAAHHRLVRDGLATHHGREVDTAGDGFFAAFDRATDAVAAAVTIQRALAAHPWPPGEPVRVRMGLHTGEPVTTADGYTGLAVHQAARIMGAAHGGQVLLSDATHRLVASSLPAGVALRNIGIHALKDFDAPEPLAQLVVEGLPADFPPPRTLVTRPNNLPQPPTPLIGRDADVESVLGLFRGGTRLVTLTGPGGTGKTRLALEIAGRLLDAPELGPPLEAGAWFVALAPIADPALVLPTVADALGVKEVPGRPVAEALAEHVGVRPMLVVLDNFEQVLGAAPFVSDWLMACPALRVLATSRAALRLQGEREQPVSPLALPEHGRVDIATLSQFAAVRLFIERATAVRPDFRVDNQSAPAVAEICARLDGLPLAIELAAARVRLFPPEAMLARLARSGPERLNLLRGGVRDAPDRHQTLRNTIQWSYDLLMPEEQRLFRRLAAFVGGCTLEAAEALGTDAHPDPAEGVLTLLDHSLLRRDEVEAAADGEPRFRMLETIREFGLTALAASGEEPAVREAHAGHFLALAEQAEPHLTGTNQAAWLGRLDAEWANLRAALAHLEASDDLEAALRMGKALGRFWIVRSHLGEGYRRLGSLIERSSEHPPTASWTAVRNTAGIMATMAGDVETAIHHLDEVIRACRVNCDTCGLAPALSHLGWTYIEMGEIERGRPLCEEALRLYRSLGDLRGIAIGLQNLGVLATLEGRYDASEVLLRESQEARLASGEQRGIAFVNHWFAFNALLRGRAEEAAAYAAEGLALVRPLCDAQIEAVMTSDAGLAALDLERVEEAAACFDVAVDLWERSGNPSGLSYALSGQAGVAVARGCPEEAISTLERALGLVRPTQMFWSVAYELNWLGEACLAAGDLVAARAHFEESQAISARISHPPALVYSRLGLGAVAAAEGRHADAKSSFAQAARLLAETSATLPPRLAKRYGVALAAASSEEERRSRNKTPGRLGN